MNEKRLLTKKTIVSQQKDYYYYFDELSEEAKKKAISNCIDKGIGCFDTVDQEDLTNDFASILEEKGFPIDDIEWRLSYNQGDGVAFYGEVDNDKLINRLTDGNLKKKLSELNEEFTMVFTITRNQFSNHYSHYNTMDIEYYGDPQIDEDDTADEVIDKFMELIIDDVKETSKELESVGYSYIEGVESEESLREFLKDNDYKFNEDGSLFS